MSQSAWLYQIGKDLCRRVRFIDNNSCFKIGCLQKKIYRKKLRIENGIHNSHFELNINISSITLNKFLNNAQAKFNIELLFLKYAQRDVVVSSNIPLSCFHIIRVFLRLFHVTRNTIILFN